MPHGPHQRRRRDGSGLQRKQRHHGLRCRRPEQCARDYDLVSRQGRIPRDGVPSHHPRKQHPSPFQTSRRGVRAVPTWTVRCVFGAIPARDVSVGGSVLVRVDALSEARKEPRLRQHVWNALAADIDATATASVQIETDGAWACQRHCEGRDGPHCRCGGKRRHWFRGRIRRDGNASDTLYSGSRRGPAAMRDVDDIGLDSCPEFLSADHAVMILIDNVEKVVRDGPGFKW
mmetsp:Transcript_43656/g.120817  ORF Transcript_43656/g.120817 Transcript_43656/m.120817 type:complete len:231 (-) Transcript_43656:190-882(-)